MSLISFYNSYTDLMKAGLGMTALTRLRLQANFTNTNQTAAVPFRLHVYPVNTFNDSFVQHHFEGPRGTLERELIWVDFIN